MPTSPVCTIDAAGIHMPQFSDVLTYFQNGYRTIYGADIYLGNDSQDGQWIGLQATAFYEACAMAVAVYNQFSPSTAQGAGLSSVVKVNGIARAVPSNSNVDLVVVGQAGAIISAGMAGDGVNQWALPDPVIIPISGQIEVTAVCQTPGAITAGPSTVVRILNPQQGWQTVTNPTAATPGQPVESDGALRQRQTTSVALPSVTAAGGTIGAVLAVPGVARLQYYENDNNIPDANGIPGHAISMVVDGGDALAVATAIALKKTVGAGTYGDAVETVTDPKTGLPTAINFFRPTIVPVTYTINLKALTGYTATVQANIQTAVAAWTTALGIGNSVLLTRVYVPANLSGGAGSQTFEIVSVTASRGGAPPTAADITIAFNEAAQGDPTLVLITAVTS